jgi:phosphatidate cytidylyltransferase
VTRVLSGAAMLVLAAAAVGFAPAVVFLVAAEILLLLAALEFERLARASGFAFPRGLSVTIAAVLCALCSRLVMPWDVPLDAFLIGALASTAIFGLAVWRQDTGVMGPVAAVLLPALYLGLPIGAIVATREVYGPPILFLLVLTVVISDTSQYYAGRLLGRHRLAPAISPNKTVEGAIGGLAGGIAFLTVAGRWWLPGMSTLFCVTLGSAVVVFGIAGDLFESVLKRRAGVKDSGSWIPGHGGVLDRIDALLFAAPVYFFLLKQAGVPDL